MLPRKLPRNPRKRSRAEKTLQRFPFWRKIARPELERDSGLKSENNDRQANASRRDLSEDWENFRSPLSKVSGSLLFDIEAKVRQNIQSHYAENPFRVFDIGCGAGTALKELKGLFGGRISTTGLVFEKTPRISYTGVDKLLVGDVNTVGIRGSFDLVFSFAGALFHSPLKTTALQRVISVLKPGGTAVLEIGAHRMQNEPNEKLFGEAKTLLLQNGVRDFSFAINKGLGLEKYVILTFTKPKPKLP